MLVTALCQVLERPQQRERVTLWPPVHVAVLQDGLAPHTEEPDTANRRFGA
jgi:hypothetical protein